MVVLGNCGESESDKAIEDSEVLNFYFSPSPPYFPPWPTTFPPSPSYFPPSPPYFPPLPTTFPPSPPYFPPYSPAPSNSSQIYHSSAIFMRKLLPKQPMEDRQAVELALYAEYIIQDRGGVLDVIPGGKLMQINGLEQQHEDIDRSTAYEELALLPALLDGRVYDGTRCSLSGWDPEYDEVEAVDVQQYRICYTGGAVDTIPAWGALTSKVSEVSDGQDLSTTPEPPLIFQEKSSIRLWQGNHGDWGVEFRFEWNWLNIGTFKIEGSALTNEWVFRCRGGKDHIDFPFPELSPNRNREEPTTARITEIPTPALPPTTQQENPYEDFGLWCSGVTGNDGVEAVGIGSWYCCDSTTIQGSQSKLNYACREYSTHIWPTHSNRTPMLVDQVEIPLLNSDTLPSDQALASAVDTNSVLVKEIPPPLVLPTALQENLDEDLDNDEVEANGIGGEGIEEDEIVEDQSRTGCFGKRKRKEKIPGGERGNNKITRVRNVIPLEEILQIKEMLLKDAAKHLKVSQSKLKSSCREYGIHRWPPRDEHKLVRLSLPDEITPIVDQDGILPQLISNCVPSNQPLAATDDANSVVKEIPPLWISPTPRQENRDENFANDEIDVIGMGGVGTGEGEMEEGQLNSGTSGKGKMIEKTSRGERGNNKTTGVRIAISLEDILQTKEMPLKDAAKLLNVSRSTLKRACREYKIYRWPPREERKLLSQYSHPNKSPTVVDQGQIPQLNDDTLQPSNQVPTTVNTNSTVTVKARCGKETIKFRLSWPWGTVELKQQVKKRLELEDGTYCIRYKDEDDELILIACNDDLQDCISSSSKLASKSIEILLEPK